MSKLVRARSAILRSGSDARKLGVRSALLVAALALVPSACGKSSSDDDDDVSAGQGGSSGATAGGGAGGKAAGTGGKAGAAGKGGGAGNAGSSGKGGSAGSTAGTSDAAGGAEEAGSGGATSGTAGVGGSAGTAGNGGGTGGDAGSGGNGELPEELWLLIEAFCATARTCCEMAGEPAGALAACEKFVASDVSTFALVAMGTITLNMKALVACVEAYGAAAKTCTMAEVDAACHGIFSGTLADGEPCSDAFECDHAAGPKICEIIQDGTPPYVGTCVDPARGTLDTPCSGSCPVEAHCMVTSVSSEPLPHAFCWEEDGLYCQSGESCAELVADGDECTDFQACGSDGYCSGSCDSLAGLDDECSFTPDCEPGLLCESGRCIAEPFANSSTCMGHMPDLD